MFELRSEGLVGKLTRRRVRGKCTSGGRLCLCKGCEVRTSSLPLRSFKNLAWLECREKRGEWLDVGFGQ